MRWKLIVAILLIAAMAPTVAMHVAGVTVHAALAALEQLTSPSRGQ